MFSEFSFINNFFFFIFDLQDCNGDGRINCYDHAAIHVKGGYGCKEPLPEKYSYVFENCVGQFLRV